MAPLYAISTTISVALGSIDKAHVRLEYVLNKDTGSTVGKEQPSLYALSEMIWSQLVQIRMFCPPSSMNIIIDNLYHKYHESSNKSLTSWNYAHSDLQCQ